jgi:hypothetical protein
MAEALEVTKLYSVSSMLGVTVRAIRLRRILMPH